MGDPVSAMAALGLAANIGQMIGYSLRIVSKSKELRKSLDGSLPENRHKTVVTESLLSASCTISGFLKSCKTADKDFSPEDEHLQDISNACGAIARDLLGELERLTLIPGTKHVKWNSFRQALWGGDLPSPMAMIAINPFEASSLA